MNAKVQGIISKGSQGTIVDIECHLSNNLPTIIIVGSANKAVDEAKERIRGAFATSHILLPRKRVTINLAPADVPKADSGFDLAMAVAILLADGQVKHGLGDKQAIIGELGLDGSTRAVRGIIGKILLGRSKGLDTFFIPKDNLPQAQLVPQVRLIPVDSLQQLYNYLNLAIPIKAVQTGDGKYQPAAQEPPAASLYLSDVIGQGQAKRALEIAAAGGHNVFLHGPPGTGKSMLAKALSSILPPLSREEMLEVTHLHSLASHDYEQLVLQRPFRAPHHSASHVAVVGGGTWLRPGEISLAHRGVLFFDELPEFDRDTIEALRQPLEDRIINVARVKEMASFPANFIFIATANPCPCGYAGTDRKCSCGNSNIVRYQNRLSGPILDRFDLHCQVGEVEHNKLLSQSTNYSSDEQIRLKVQRARQVQSARFASQSKLNNDMSNADIKQLARLEPSATTVLNLGGHTYRLSGRAYMRTIKVARTIADLSASPSITKDHISEALNYRYQPLKTN